MSTTATPTALTPPVLYAEGSTALYARVPPRPAMAAVPGGTLVGICMWLKLRLNMSVHAIQILSGRELSGSALVTVNEAVSVLGGPATATSGLGV